MANCGDNPTLCLLCMEIHPIKIVKATDSTIYKNKYVEFEVEYEYCEFTDGYLETEEQIRNNWESMRNAREMLSE